jgi:dipeptidyl aminopeptidase/acylaminoacyl peptidase
MKKFMPWGIALAAIAVTGAVTFLPAQGNQVRLVLVDREGHQTHVGFLPARAFAPRIAPDGKQVIYDADGAVWIADLSNLAAARRLAPGRFPLWSVKGEQIIFAAGPAVEEALYTQRGDGTNGTERIWDGRSAESWSVPNGVFSFIKFSGYYSIWTYSLTDKKAARLFDAPGINQHSSMFSPDGKWIAYASDETGRIEVFARRFPLTEAKFQISKQGGGHPLWSPDGKEIFFDNTGQLFAVRVETIGSFSVLPAVALPVMGFIQGVARRQYDLMPDGKRFLMIFRP